MIRASISGAVDSGLISSRVISMTLKLISQQFPWNSAKNKLANLVVVQLEKALSRFPHRGVVNEWATTP